MDTNCAVGPGTVLRARFHVDSSMDDVTNHVATVLYARSTSHTRGLPQSAPFSTGDIWDYRYLSRIMTDRSMAVANGNLTEILLRADFDAEIAGSKACSGWSYRILRRLSDASSERDMCGRGSVDAHQKAIAAIKLVEASSEAQHKQFDGRVSNPSFDVTVDWTQ